MSEAAPQHDEHLKDFFLDLARPRADTEEARAEARERWNAWRRDPANAGVPVNFAGVDFRLPVNAGISFAGFEFGDGARFDSATFGDGARFDSATFGDKARFVSGTFGDETRFDNAKFGHLARFDCATFGKGVRFDSATFGVAARFECAIFGHLVRFDCATFEHMVRFDSTIFGHLARFDGATFGKGARFDSATFGSAATFRAVLLQGSATFAGSPAGTWLTQMRERCSEDTWAHLVEEKLGKEFLDQKEREGFGPHAFLDLDFSDARILGPISFARRSFERPANFTGAQFHAPPDFDGASNLQRIDFTGARIGFAPPNHFWWRRHWNENSNVPVRLRAFRKIAEDTKNHDLERDLYIEERKAERGVHRRRLHDALRAEKHVGKKLALLGPLFIAWCWRRVMDGYWLFSDYGRSLLRPPVWLLLTLWPLVWAFDASLTAQRRSATQSAIASASEKPAEAAKAMKRQYYAATRQLAISNTIPFVGPLSIDGEVKKLLLCGLPATDPRLKECAPIAPRGYQLTLIGQNVLSALLLFFFGLALRNYFKVK